MGIRFSEKKAPIMLVSTTSTQILQMVAAELYDVRGCDIECI